MRFFNLFWRIEYIYCMIFSWNSLTLFYFVGQTCSYSKCMSKHIYVGEKEIDVQAQSPSKTKNSLTLEFECNNLPAKLDVQIRPTSGPHKNFIFPGIPSAQRDDDVNSTYGGVVYYYSEGDANIFVPNKATSSPGFGAGRNIFTGR